VGLLDQPAWLARATLIDAGRSSASGGRIAVLLLDVISRMWDCEYRSDVAKALRFANASNSRPAFPVGCWPISVPRTLPNRPETYMTLILIGPGRNVFVTPAV